MQKRNLCQPDIVWWVKIEVTRTLDGQILVFRTVICQQPTGNAVYSSNWFVITLWLFTYTPQVVKHSSYRKTRQTFSHIMNCRRFLSTQPLIQILSRYTYNKIHLTISKSIWSHSITLNSVGTHIVITKYK